jgi:hypothetical protein
MTAFDLLAYGFLAIMAVLGMCGLFRKLGRLLWGGATGLVLGCLLLATLGVIARTGWFAATFDGPLPKSRIVERLADGAEPLVSRLTSKSRERPSRGVGSAVVENR